MPEKQGHSTSAACGCARPSNSNQEKRGWKRKYFLACALLAMLWLVAYFAIEPISRWLIFNCFQFAPDSHLGQALQFFIYDSAKILLLLASLIYIIAWLRAGLDNDRIREFLAGKKRALGYALAAFFGAATPFCSCSSIPLFIGFTSAGLPFGMAMAFLITSPLINEIALVLLWGLLGWKFTLIYICVGLLCGILGGIFMDAARAERWLRPFILEQARQRPLRMLLPGARSISVWQRHKFAVSETRSMFLKVWKWVLLGVGIGAALHGYVPEDWFARHFGAGQWWTVPCAALAGIPLYSNVAGIVPVMESLLLKGMPIGTTLAFCMGAVAASLPEFMLLRQIMTLRLQAFFIAWLWLMFTLAGWLFNYLGASMLL